MRVVASPERASIDQLEKHTCGFARKNISLRNIAISLLLWNPCLRIIINDGDEWCILNKILFKKITFFFKDRESIYLNKLINFTVIFF